jgi:hypothetical protein
MNPQAMAGETATLASASAKSELAMPNLFIATFHFRNHW